MDLTSQFFRRCSEKTYGPMGVLWGSSTKLWGFYQAIYIYIYSIYINNNINYEMSSHETKGFTNIMWTYDKFWCCVANLMVGSTSCTDYWVATFSTAWCLQEISLTRSAAKWPFCHRWWGNHKQGSAGEGCVMIKGDSWGINGPDQRENINPKNNVHGLGYVGSP